MEQYDYLEAIKQDVRNYISENVNLDLVTDWDAFENELQDDLFNNDSVTGYASSSYTFNAWEAEEYLCHNFGLLSEALDCFGYKANFLKEGAEACDVMIRCYLLPDAISSVICELEDAEG